MGSKIDKITKTIERRTYVKGDFSGKYHGDIDKLKLDFGKASYYNINVYEGELKNVVIIHEKEYQNEQSELHFMENRFENVVSVTDHKIEEFDAFRFKIIDPKVKKITLKNVIKEGNQTFGVLECEVFGYLLDYIETEEEIEVEICNNCKKLLHDCKCTLVETPIPILPTTPTTKKYPKPEYQTYFSGCLEGLGWIILTGFGIAFLFAIGYQGIIIVLLFAVIYYLLSVIPRILGLVFNILSWILRLFYGIIFIFFIMSLVSGLYSSFTNNNQNRTSTSTTENTTREKSKKIKLNDSNTLITHHRIWKDYEDNVYQGDLSVLESDYLISNEKRNSSHFNLYDDFQWSLLYNSLVSNDKMNLNYVYKTFDSIGKSNHLNQKQFAEMIVSCVQDINYALVLQGNCDMDDYEEDFIKNVLEKCGPCCIGNIKYGVQSPIEFVANLKGDCDTRTLLLFTILSKFGYKVAILGSLAYQHSILAVNLPYNGIYKIIDGEKFYVWETTSAGFTPGYLNPEMTNMNLWNVHLLNKNN